LTLETLAERNLRLAVPASHPLAAHDSVNVADLRGQRWIAGPAAGEELLMGVWPGLDERPVIAHTVRDWLAKLQLVAAGAGLTTISASMAPAAPPGVRVVTVSGGSKELRRTILARLPGRMSEPAALLADTLRTAALEVGPAG
jgi:DNA-binding transcriptional LysR family regulator